MCETMLRQVRAADAKAKAAIPLPSCVRGFAPTGARGNGSIEG